MEIKPFRAFRYDASVVGDVGSCIAPPFDVIDPDRQQRLYQKSVYNIVRIIRGQTAASDNDSKNQYTRAADFLHSWIDKGVLKQDPVEAIYAYVQDFELAGTSFQRFSFIALGKLEEFGPPGPVRPHEEIFDAPMIDRLNLKRATSADFGLVFMLYDDPDKLADKIMEDAIARQPLIDFIDEENVRHRLFAITDIDRIRAISKMMLGKSCIIADGHHRYATGLRYCIESGKPAAEYQMIAFCNSCQEGLMILACHRLLGNLGNFNPEKFIAELKEDFEVARFGFDSPAAKTQAKQQMLARMKAEYAAEGSAFGIYGGNGVFYVATLKDKRAMDAVAPNMSSSWRALDAAVLHRLVLNKILAIDEEKLARQGNLQYIKDTPQAVDDSICRIDAGQKQVAFFMNPARLQQLRTVTQNGEKMPPKSTYFYPKMYTGLTIYKL